MVLPANPQILPHGLRNESHTSSVRWSFHWHFVSVYPILPILQSHVVVSSSISFPAGAFSFSFTAPAGSCSLRSTHTRGPWGWLPSSCSVLLTRYSSEPWGPETTWKPISPERTGFCSDLGLDGGRGVPNSTGRPTTWSQPCRGEAARCSSLGTPLKAPRQIWDGVFFLPEASQVCRSWACPRGPDRPAVAQRRLFLTPGDSVRSGTPSLTSGLL